jgi:hypothetical protein
LLETRGFLCLYRLFHAAADEALAGLLQATVKQVLESCQQLAREADYTDRLPAARQHLLSTMLVNSIVQPCLLTICQQDISILRQFVKRMAVLRRYTQASRLPLLLLPLPPLLLLLLLPYSSIRGAFTIGRCCCCCCCWR